MNSRFIKGVIWVALGAACYGMIATFVKVGAKDGYSTAELTFAQGFVGLLGLTLLNLIQKLRKPTLNRKVDSKSRWQLILGGIPFGLTSSFYYLSLNYASVSVCIVMLMQSVWIGSVLDYILYRNKPTKNKLMAIAVVLVGTVLATNLLSSDQYVDWRGIVWGFMAALSYTVSISVTNRVATGYPPLVRSMYILIGSFCVVTLIWGYSLSQQFDISVLWRWGFLIALFGTILSPLLFTKGMPIIGIGLGSILASVELPVSVTMAWLILGETVDPGQWIGIILILSAVVLMNLSYFQPVKSD
ncbi:DMT family transporter [Dysgonomonas sp. OttesenSCG-928-M03]|nr:DMT family transporter [Dysgonomonas sp. OttesenSCG-928-M03]